MRKFNTNIFHPAWVTGFIDGEGTFSVGIQKNKTIALGVQVQLQFSITQHIRDLSLMQQFPAFFGAGAVSSDGPTKVQYRMRGFKDLERYLFPLLDKYPLMTQKRLDAEAFRAVHVLMKSGRHLTPDGLNEIRTIKDSMNRGRMARFKSNYNPQYIK